MSGKIESLVSCQWLKDAIDKGLPDNVVICDVSWSSTTDMKAQYDSAHIPGAVYLKVMDESQFSVQYPRNLPDINTFQQNVRECGISSDDHVILYSNSDMNGFFISGRAWWTFKVFGHDKISLLDGGLTKWKSEGFPLTDIYAQPKLGNFTAKFTDRFILNFDEMRQKVKLGSIQICDSRESSKYSGAESTGHIKGSTNIPLTSMMNKEDATLKSPDEIRKDLALKGIDLEKPVIMYCNTGMSSCSLAFVSFLCGGKDVAVYLGGFTEWSMKADKKSLENL